MGSRGGTPGIRTVPALKVPDSMRPPHALVIGGTGMLAGVTWGLAERGMVVTVVARRPERLTDRARTSARGAVHPLAVDYRDTRALVEGIASARRQRGPLQLVVCWIHDDAPAAADAIGSWLNHDGHPCVYVRVLGSSTTDPSVPDAEREARMSRYAFLEYREVILGFKRLGSGSRWLTDREIAAGVLAAIVGGARRQVVGVVQPWSARPGGRGQPT